MRKNTHTHIRDVIPDVLDKFCSDEPVTDTTDSVMTGISALDHKIGGLRNGDLITIAGRPSTGKTTVAANIIARASALAPNPVTSVAFSQEEAADRFAMRILSTLSRTKLKGIHADELTTADRDRLRQMGDLLSCAPIVIDDTPGILLSELTTRCRQIAFDAKSGDMPPLGIVLVDYIQLLRSDEKLRDPANEISRVSPGLKKLAEILNVPVIVLSQLSRKVEERPSRRPILSDLDPTLADESDMVLLLSHDTITYSPLLSVMEVMVAKHPNDRTGRIEL